MAAITAAAYSRRAGVGTLKLSGVVDIFEAAALRAAALQAATDPRAGSIRISMADVERLDLSALQILLALRRALKDGGRSLVVHQMPPSVKRLLEKIDFDL